MTAPPQSIGAMLRGTPLRATEPQFRQFVRGLDAILQQWTALILVCRNRDETALQCIRDEVLEWFFETGEVYSDELEEYFDDFFSSVRHVSVEDGSTKEVSDAIHDVYCTCCRDDFSLVERYVQMLQGYLQYNNADRSVFQGWWEGSAAGVPVQVSAADDEDGDEEVEAGEELQEGVGASVQRPGMVDGEVPVELEGEEEAQAPPQQQRKSKGKNPFVKSKDGWCTVQRKK